MSEVSAVWHVVQEWMDQQRFPPTQSKLASAIGVSRSAVSDWKSGKTRPSPENIEHLAKLMEPTLGPDIHMVLMVAVMRDYGYELDVNTPERISFLLASASAEEKQLARELSAEDAWHRSMAALTKAQIKPDIVTKDGRAFEVKQGRIYEFKLLPDGMYALDQRSLLVTFDTNVITDSAIVEAMPNTVEELLALVDAETASPTNLAHLPALRNKDLSSFEDADKAARNEDLETPKMT